MATMRLTVSSMFITPRFDFSPVFGLTTSSSWRYLPVMSSTLITRLASPAMAAP